MKLIVLDTETSDLHPSQGAQILELAWLELELKDGVWKLVFSTDFYLEYDGPISPHAQAVHHIRADKLTTERGAVVRADAIQMLLEHIPHESYMVAHNAAFDAGFLPEVTRPWICTMRAARHIWQNAPGYSNQVLRYWLKVSPVDVDPSVELRYPHQARYDAATTAALLLKMLENHTVEQLLLFSKTPVRLKRIDFGKHKGMPFEVIPKDYLQYLRRQPDLNADVAHTINEILGP